MTGNSTGRRFDTNAASKFLLDEEGVKLAPGTLRKRRCVGGGPRFYKAAGAVFYSESSLREFAATIRSPEVSSTSELCQLDTGRG